MRAPRDEDDARFLMGLRGYVLQHGGVYFVIDADETRIIDYLIGPWTGTHLDAWRKLNDLGWPKSRAWGEVHV